MGASIGGNLNLGFSGVASGGSRAGRDALDSGAGDRSGEDSSEGDLTGGDLATGAEWGLGDIAAGGGGGGAFFFLESVGVGVESSTESAELGIWEKRRGMGGSKPTRGPPCLAM